MGRVPRRPVFQCCLVDRTRGLYLVRMSILSILEHSDSAGSARLGRLVRDHGFGLDVRRPHRGDAIPTSLSGIRAVVSMGGPMNVDQPDGHPWMPYEIEYLKRAHDSGLAVIGVCLGCQLLATALGGEVTPFEDRSMEIGWQVIRLTPAGQNDPVLAG